MTIDEVKEKIENKEYPHVARLSEPYLTRLSELTLVVNDVTYTAKIKDGVNVHGFMIYSSGLGIPVYEDLEKKNNGDFNGKSKLKESTDKARKWIDELEIAIAETVNDNPIKKAIDRLCWQMHYDITTSTYNMKSLDDFADVDIDMGTEVDGLYTVHNTMIDAAEIITVGGTGSEVGTLAKIAQNIETLYTNVDTMNATFEDYDDHMKSYLIGSDGSSIYGIINTTNTSIKTCLTGGDSTKNIYSILETTSNKICITSSDDNPQQTMWDALRGNNVFSIAQCLRDSINNSCVAKEIEDGATDITTATESRTQAEDAAFGEIEGRIGEPGQGNSVWATVKNINGNQATQTDTVWGFGNDIKSAIGNSGDGITTSSVFGKINRIDDCVGTRVGSRTISERIGNPGDGTDYSILSTMHGNGGTRNGFVNFLTQGVDTYYVKAASSSGGIQW